MQRIGYKQEKKPGFGLFSAMSAKRQFQNYRDGP